MARGVNLLRGMAIMSTALGCSPSGAAEVIVRLKSPIESSPAAIRVMVPPDMRFGVGAASRVQSLTITSPGAEPATAVLVFDPATQDQETERGATLFVVAGSLPAGEARAVTNAEFQASELTSVLSAANRSAALRFSPRANGGLPTAIAFPESGKLFETFAWNDRVHEPSRGGWLLRNDRNPMITVLWKSSELAVIRSAASYCNDAGSPAPGNVRAVYDWYVPRHSDTIFVQAFTAQDQPQSWSELHHLELNFPDESFGGWAAGNPVRSGNFVAERKGWDASHWGCILQGNDAIGIIGQPVRFYDGRGEYGTYIHGAWSAWTSLRRLTSAWMWIGSMPDAAARVQAAAEVRRAARAAITTPQRSSRIARLRAPTKPARAQWLATVAERAEEAGDVALAEALLNAAESPATPLPRGWEIAKAGDLWMAVRQGSEGMSLASLYDSARRTELAAADQPPLFHVRLAKTADGETVEVESGSGWGSAEAKATSNALTLVWAQHKDPRLSGLRITATAQLDQRRSALRWKLNCHPGDGPYGVRSVMFPQIAVEPMAADARALYPVGPGEEASLDRTPSINRTSLYPNGWCTIPLMAVYSPTKRAGLYVACHDPLASAKQVIQRREGADHPVVLSFDVPAPDMDRSGVPFAWPGVTVWQALRGDWFDAARIYREWASAEAAWWPKDADAGRKDTPVWMRELCAWAQTGGAPAECVEAVKQMQRTLGVPIGFHWYNWHQIPFDNDYPHYFPTKPGVADAVADLQAHQVHVMPYINGRLWDTRDRGTEDYQFTSRALPSATKDAQGKPVTETYGSKEADDTPVRLAVMCPTTELWQSVVRDTVLRIMNEVGAHGVYIDQIAAAAPVLCMDASHGHPVGGGHWWTRDGYWPLLREIRKRMPAGHMITTECAAEPYAHVLDANLTWDWQGNGMVPVLPAIYGGRVQYFGRNYAAGATTRDLALCMKMGQQLVFGEQIGWLSPAIAQEPVAGSFLKQVVGVRYRNVRFFSAGEMARPPALAGDIPDVRADWAWYGETWVTTPAVLTGAWMRPKQRELLLLFVNVSDQPVRSRFDWNAAGYGITAKRITVIETAGLGEPGRERALPARTQRIMNLAPRTVQTWLVRW